MDKPSVDSLAAAAGRLGVPVAEVVDVIEHETGTVIKTFDGQSYIDVPEDHPDVDGKTGLMFLAAPSVTYAGGFPVFAQPDDEADEDDDGEAERATEVVPPPPAKSTAPAKGTAPAKRTARGRGRAPKAAS